MTGDIVNLLVKTFFKLSRGIIVTDCWEICSGGGFRTFGHLELLPDNCFGLPPTIFSNSDIPEGIYEAGDNEEFGHVEVVPVGDRLGHFIVTLHRTRYDNELGDFIFMELISCNMNMNVHV